MNENEEFEFRHRLEQEQASSSNKSSSKDGVVKQAFKGAVVEPLQEVRRGYHEGASNVYKNLDMLAGLLGKATGGGSSGTFGELAEVESQNAQRVPPTSMNPTIKSGYQMVGGAVPAVAEFAILSRAIPLTKVQSLLASSMGNTFKAKQVASNLSDSAVLAVQGAINGHTQNPEDPASAVHGAAQYGATGLAFPVGAEALKLTKNFGVNAGKAFIEFVTGNAKLANDYAKNMWKYNTNPFGKVKNPQEVSIANKDRLDTLKRESSVSEFELQTKQQQEKHVFDSKLNEAMTGVKESNRLTKEAAAEGRTAKLSQTVDQAKASLQKTKDAVDTSLYGHVTHAVEYLQERRGNLGNSVNEAVKNVVYKDPGAVVGRKPLMGAFEKTLKEHGFEIKDSVVSPKAGMGLESSTTNTLQGLYDDIIAHFDSPKAPTGVTVDYLQSLKKRVQDVAYSGQSSYSGNILKRLSGALKPENFVDDILGRDISQELSQLKAANKDFSIFAKQHDEAIELLTSTDAAGKPIADTKRILNAIKSGDKKTQILMMRADGALPDGLKIRPQMDKVMRATSEAESVYASKVKTTRRLLSKEKQELERKIRAKESEIRRADADKKFTKAQGLRQELQGFRQREDAKLLDIENTMKAEEEFLTEQKALRQVFASGRAGNLQTGSLIGLGGGVLRTMMRPDALGASMTALGATAGTTLAPVVASNMVKGADVVGRAVTQPASDVIRKLLESRLAKVVYTNSRGNE